MILRFSSVMSMMDPQDPQARDWVCSRPRTESGAPQPGHCRVLILSVPGASGRAVFIAPALSPSIKFSQARQLEPIKFNIFTQKNQGRKLTVVNGAEAVCLT